jgi:hypothetical protein
MIHPSSALAAAVLCLLAAPALAQTPPSGGPGNGRGGGMGPPPALADVPAWADRIFDRLDANQDGAITGDELAVLSSGPVGAMGGGMLRRVIAQSDASNDGRISREELAAGAERWFRRMDANGDGVLSDDERPRPPAPAGAPTVPMPQAQPEPMPFPDLE